MVPALARCHSSGCHHYTCDLLFVYLRCLPALLVFAFQRNFPKYRVHFCCCSLSLSLFSLFCFSDVALSLCCCCEYFCSIPPLFSLLRGDGGVVGFFVCSCSLSVLVWSRGLFLHGLRKNLTNFKCFCFPSKSVCFCVCCFGCLCQRKKQKCNA